MNEHTRRWTSTKIAARLKLIRPLIHRDREPLEPLRYVELDEPDAPPPVGPDVDDGDWRVVEPDTYWAAQTTDFVFRSGFTVPAHWEEGPIALHLPMGVAGDIFTHPESLLYVDGVPFASADRHHHVIRLEERCRDGRRHALALHGWTGLAGWPPDPSLRTRLFMQPCSLVRLDEPTQAFVSLAEMVLETAEALGDERPERHRLLGALDAAFVALDTRDPLRSAAFWDSVPDALETLREGVAAAGAPLDVDVVAVGHAHMDIAYLWPVSQMRRKNARTYTNVLRIMAANPGYRYSHDQPQLYRYTEEDYPELFERIRARVADGAWEPMGGMWVEPDTNITGGESLVRQLLLGRTYFATRFGDLAESAGRAPGERVDTPVLWLPDTFGFTWSLPQLMRQAGLHWFLTSKINWNQYNRLPAQTLWWQGIDGTRVLTHFLTTPRSVQHLPFPTTYKAEVTPAEVLGTWTNYSQKPARNELMMVYGYGDGGGGPTQELVRKAAIMGEMPGMPRVRMGTVREFFERLEASGTDTLPVWNDELYMEGHRGVLTTHGDIKRANRRAERLLHRVELVAATAAAATGHAYPHAALGRAWELLCLNQFHDVLPGTAITEVFVDARRDYAEIASIGREAFDAATGALAAALGGAPVGARDEASRGSLPDTRGRAGRRDGSIALPVTCWLVVNTAPVAGDPIVLIGDGGGGASVVGDEHGDPLAHDDRDGRSAFAAVDGGMQGSTPAVAELGRTATRLVDAATGRDVRYQDVAGGRLVERAPAPAGSVAAWTLLAADDAAVAVATSSTGGSAAVSRTAGLDRPVEAASTIATGSGGEAGSSVHADTEARAGFGTGADAGTGAEDGTEPDVASASATDEGFTLENACLRVEFDARGRLVRLLDRERGRDVLAAGRHGNVLQAFEDRPLNWDAWDVDAFIDDRPETIDGLDEARVVESGPLRASLRLERTYRASRIVQHVRLLAGGRRVEFHTEIDWHETHTLLKVAFPVAVLSPRATYEIQWGSIERPTHRNTSWDAAKFEVAAQQWADLSEAGHGVALLNDCKYGHDIHDGVLRLSLIKSPTSPDPVSDQGRHRFAYALLPHAGGWREGDVLAEARRFNDPVMVLPLASGRAGAGTLQLVASETRHAIVETVKGAEDGDGVVVRLYESERRSGPVTLRFGLPPRDVVVCNLLEETERALAPDGRRVTLELGPFEIVSLRVRFEDGPDAA